MVVGQGLGGAHEQPALFLEEPRQIGEDLPLGLGIEVDGDVPVKNNVHPGQLLRVDVAHQVQPHEPDLPFHLFPNPVPLLRRFKVFPPECRRKPPERKPPVEALFRPPEDLGVDVRADHLDEPLNARAVPFENLHHHRIGLFPGGAPGAENANRLARHLGGEHLPEQLVGKEVKLEGLTEKIRFVDGEQVDQGTEFSLLPPEAGQVLLLAPHSPRGHPGPHPIRQDGHPLGLEGEAAPFPDQGLDGGVIHCRHRGPAASPAPRATTMASSPLISSRERIRSMQPLSMATLGMP